METFIDTFIDSLYSENNWYLKVWAREVVNSSPIVNDILMQEALPRLDIVSQIFSQYTNLPVTDPELYSCILITLSPFAITFLSHNTELLPVQYPREELISHLKRFIFSGLDEFKKD